MMVDMLSHFQDRAITKMMLDSIPTLLSQDTEIMLNFFKNAFFKPALMQRDIIIPWPEDKDDHLFAYHTSLILEETMLTTLWKGNEDIISQKIITFE